MVFSQKKNTYLLKRCKKHSFLHFTTRFFETFEYFDLGGKGKKSRKNTLKSQKVHTFCFLKKSIFVKKRQITPKALFQFGASGGAF